MVKPQSYESDLGGVAKSLKEISAEDVLQTAIKYVNVVHSCAFRHEAQYLRLLGLLTNVLKST